MSRDRNVNVDFGDRMCPSEMEHEVVTGSQDFTPNRSVLLLYVLKKRLHAIGHVKMDAGESVSHVRNMFRCSVDSCFRTVLRRAQVVVRDVRVVEVGLGVPDVLCGKCDCMV